MIPFEYIKRLLKRSLSDKNVCRFDERPRVVRPALSLLHHAVEGHLKTLLWQMGVLARSRDTKTVLAEHFNTIQKLQVYGVVSTFSRLPLPSSEVSKHVSRPEQSVQSADLQSSPAAPGS